MHVHILPRRPGDYLNNDDIYRDLAKHDKEDSTIGKWRSDDEMAREADFLKNLFKWYRNYKFPKTATVQFSSNWMSLQKIKTRKFN